MAGYYKQCSKCGKMNDCSICYDCLWEENKFLLAEVKRLEAELAEERRYWK